MADLVTDGLEAGIDAGLDAVGVHDPRQRARFRAAFRAAMAQAVHELPRARGRDAAVAALQRAAPDELTVTQLAHRIGDLDDGPWLFTNEQARRHARALADDPPDGVAVTPAGRGARLRWVGTRA